MSSQMSYRVILQPLSEGGYMASVPALPDLQSFGETMEQAKANIAREIEGMVATYGDLAPPDFRDEPVVDVVRVGGQLDKN